MMNKLIFLLLIAVNFMVGQMLQLPKNIQSPNAASLGKYGDIPMNYYTGRANVNIPLYSLNEGGIPLDISLSYDTGGVRVNDVPGWVGQNWTLNAGGVITRTVKGGEFDELLYNYGVGYLRNKQYEKLNTNNWSDTNNLISLVKSGKFGLNVYLQDLEPDLFTFNFMGHTGKFFLGHDGNWKVQSDSNLKVEILESNFILPMNIKNVGPYGSYQNIEEFPKVIGKITLTDEQGNKFIFGGNYHAIEYSLQDFFNQLSGIRITANSWYLKEVIDKHNTTLYTFEYERGKPNANFYLSGSYRSFSKSSGGSSTSSPNVLLNLEGQLIYPVYLKKIKSNSNIAIDFISNTSKYKKYNYSDYGFYDRFYRWRNENNTFINNGQGDEKFYHYDFYYLNHQFNEDGTIEHKHIVGDPANPLKPLIESLEWRELNQIVISNNSSFKTIGFSFSSAISERLSLRSLYIDNKKYTFDYDNFSSLPSFTADAFDHFGYYNGMSMSKNIDDNYYLSRQINSTYLKYGSLKKITYPTGGWTEFEYEPHSYSKCVSADGGSFINEIGNISGLRIKKITDFENTTNKITREFLYKQNLNDSNSNGILLVKPKYLYKWDTKTDWGNTYYETAFDVNNIIPLANFSGTTIEYPNVIEKTEGNGYTRYSYSSYNDYKNTFANTLSTNHSIFDQKTDMSYKRGKLLKQEVFDIGGNLKSEINNIYDESVVNKVRGFDFQVKFPFVVDNIKNANDEIIITGNAYEIYYSDFKLKEKNTKNYFPTGTVEERTNYTYYPRENFGDTFLRTKETQTTNNQNLKEEYKYTFDKTTPSFISATNKRDLSVVNTKITNNTTSISQTQIEYAPFTLKPNVIVDLPQKLSSKKGDNVAEDKLIIDKYDEFGNIIRARNVDGNYYTYIWGYNGSKLIAKVEGSSYIEDSTLNYLPTNLLSKTFTQSDYNLLTKDMITKYNTHQFVFYTYKNDTNIESITQPNGIIEYYNYDSQGRLITITNQEGIIIKNFYYNFKK